MDQQTKNQLSIRSLCGPKACRGLVLSLILITGTAADAARWVLPPGFQGQVWVANPSRTPESLYVKDLAAGSEDERLIPAKSSVGFSGLGADTQVLDATSSRLALELQFAGERPVGLLPGQTNTHYFPAERLRAGGELVITNLSSQSQDGLVLSWRPGVASPETRPFQLEARGVLRISDSGLSGSAFSVEAPLNIASFWKNADHYEFPDLKINPRPLPPARGVRFLLADEEKTASFFVDLTDPVLIEKARAQIKNKDVFMGRILMAEISADNSGENHNSYDALKFPWSWKVSRALSFAQMASQACDGHPQQIEDHLEVWLSGARTGGRPIICLWGFRIVEELP